MTPAELLRTLRARLGLSQTELGGKLGVSLNTIHVWEKGDREPSASHLQALARLSGVALSVGPGGWRIDNQGEDSEHDCRERPDNDEPRPQSLKA